MTKLLQVYKCEKCGNIVEVLHTGAGALVCCGEKMILMEEKSAEMKTEKHVPVISEEDGAYKVFVGSTPHPMVEKHYIEWVQLISGDKTYRIFMHPDSEPGAVFECKPKEVWAREYCNVHGLWKGEKA